MKAEPISVGKVLSENHRFVVPIYQRSYMWTEKKQLEPLFEQIEAKAQERLQKGRVDFPHYMGSLLLIPEGEATFGRVQAFDIVDGQQRLTTFHLCFSAVRNIARSLGFADLSTKLEALLLHSNDVAESDRKYGRYKLQPTAAERECFRDLIDLTSEDIQGKYSKHFYKNGRLRGDAPNSLTAYWFFLTRVHEFIKADEESARDRLLAVTDAIFQNFRFIVITLSKEDDPQVIFATLNDAGEPLAAMDLVRNDVFLRASRNQEDEERLMDRYWRIFEDSFWKQERIQGRIRKPVMDFFLAHTLAAESGELVSLSELYAEYKKYAKRKERRTVAQELEALTGYAPLYRELVAPEQSSPLYHLSRLLDKFDLSTAYPLILLIASRTIEPEVNQSLYKLIGAYIIRRALCGMTAKNYNNAFLDIVAYMRANGVSVESFAAAAEMRSNSEAAKFPTDEEFRDAVINRGQYGRVPTHRLSFIIEELELASQDRFAACKGVRAGLSIEHIMPQQWQEHWPQLPCGRSVPVAGDVSMDEVMLREMAERNSLIHTLANLSLLTPPANASAGNASFEVKRSRLRDSLLKTNFEIANNPRWSEHEIAHRARQLADLAVKIWPAPPSQATLRTSETEGHAVKPDILVA